jgi:hypothetical protein
MDEEEELSKISKTVLYGYGNGSPTECAAFDGLRWRQNA